MQSTRDRVAIQTAVIKLEALGDQLPFPHPSHVGGPIRELRPRAGRSRVRLLYGRIGETMWVLAVAPEAQVDRHAFDRATTTARQRLEECR